MLSLVHQLVCRDTITVQGRRKMFTVSCSKVIYRDQQKVWTETGCMSGVNMKQPSLLLLCFSDILKDQPVALMLFGILILVTEYRYMLELFSVDLSLYIFLKTKGQLSVCLIRCWTRIWFQTPHSIFIQHLKSLQWTVVPFVYLNIFHLGTPLSLFS